MFAFHGGFVYRIALPFASGKFFQEFLVVWTMLGFAAFMEGIDDGEKSSIMSVWSRGRLRIYLPAGFADGGGGIIAIVGRFASVETGGEIKCIRSRPVRWKC